MEQMDFSVEVSESEIEKICRLFIPERKCKGNN